MRELEVILEEHRVSLYVHLFTRPWFFRPDPGSASWGKRTFTYDGRACANRDGERSREMRGHPTDVDIVYTRERAESDTALAES